MSSQHWSKEGFLNEVKRINDTMSERRFVFILGAGASIESGIKGAAQLAREWMDLLYKRECDTVKKGTFEQWLRSNPLNCTEWDENNLAKHYPLIFERCFQGDHDSGYAELEQAIGQKTPSLGYAVLAWILSKRQHNMVITTNFDNLVADALSIYGEHYPLVIGHESLASYLKPMSRRSTVAKIHRDLFTSPINTVNGVDDLAAPWIDALKNIFKFYTPIFIGYGGNDGSLMNFLHSLDINDISGRPFWCYYEKAEAPNKEIKCLMDKHKGVLVGTQGFDELMYEIGNVLGYDREEHKNNVLARTEEILGTLDKQIVGVSNKASPEMKMLLSTHANDKQRSWVDWMLYINTSESSDEEENKYLEALEEWPKSNELMGNYANLLSKLKRDTESEIYYKKALEASPDEAYILGNYALLLSNIKRETEAEFYYKKALSITPDDPHILSNYAILLSNIKRETEAEDYYKKALSLTPDDAKILWHYGYLLSNTKREAEAEYYYKKALSLTPDDVDILVNYAFILSKIKRYAEAETYYKKALEITPDSANTLSHYANLLSEMKRYAEAEDYYKKVFEITSDDTNALGNYALLLSRINREVEAENYYKKALDIDPDAVNILGSYAFLLIQMKREAEAENYYKKAFAIAPNAVNLLGAYANLLSDMKREVEAEDYYKKVLAITPDDANALGNYAHFMKINGRLDEALEWCGKSLAIDAEHFHIITYAEILYDLKRFEEAMPFAKDAARLFPDNLDVKKLIKELEQ